MNAEKYTISDELQKLIDWEAIMKMKRCSGGHDEQMKSLFKGAKVIAHWNEGDYQGQVATCVELSDTRILIYNDWYGSCSGCDSWIDATDKEVRNLCINLSNRAKIFKSIDDVKEYLQSIIDDEDRASYDWVRCASPLLKLLNK